MSGSQLKYERTVHCRGLGSPIEQGFHLLNIKNIAHWALQVDQNYYEIAEPKYVQAGRLTTGPDEKERLHNVLVDTKEELEASTLDISEAADKTARTLLNVLEEQSGGAVAREDGGSDDEYRRVLEFLNREKVESEQDQQAQTFAVDGEAKIKLQINNGWAWRRLQQAWQPWYHRQEKLSKTSVEPELTLKRANHIYEKAFRKSYTALFQNCQAFVMYLAFSMDLIDGKAIYYDPEMFGFAKSAARVGRLGGSKVDRTHVAASLLIYRGWKKVLKEPCIEIGIDWRSPFMLGKDSKKRLSWLDWEMDESSIEYEKLIPPAKVQQMLDAATSLKPLQQPHRLPTTEARSHATHINEQIHQATLLNLQIVVNNAVLVQQTAPQQPGPHFTGHGSAHGHAGSSHGAGHHGGHRHAPGHTGMDNSWMFANPAMFGPTQF